MRWRPDSAAPRFASRLPEDIKNRIRQHGIRNSHLLSIAPTGTISLAFADNASNGIEPPFSWTYTRKKRMPDGTHKEFRVEAERCGFRHFLEVFDPNAPVNPVPPEHAAQYLREVRV